MRLMTRFFRLWDELTTPRPHLNRDTLSASLVAMEARYRHEREEHDAAKARFVAQITALADKNTHLDKLVRDQTEADLVLVSLKIIHEALTRGVVDQGLVRQQAVLQQQLTQMPALGIGPFGILGAAVGSLGGGPR